MVSRTDVEGFFRTLLLGDFEEQQNTAAQVIGGLIALIPILGQVMAGRDITGTLFLINKRGGFKNATAEQLVNLGFAGFGAIPEIGPVFKTVFKPLWKERQLAKGLVHSGLEAVEALLNLGKGGAITWVRKELIGKWAARTNAMIAAVNSALDAAIELTQFIATAGGWKNWLIPHSVQVLAQEMLPGMKQLRGQVNEPLQRASREIREFLDDLLGERAAAIVMAAGQTAVAASAVPASRTRGGRNAAEHNPKGTVPARQPEHEVQGKPATHAATGNGGVHSAMQITIKGFKDLATTQTALVGEHMADYHELKRLGGNWPHDKSAGQWSPPGIQKLNADKRPVNLGELDLKKVTHQGIDAVWQHGAHYAAVEAKGRASVFALRATVRSLGEKGLLPPPAKALSADLQMLWVLLAVTDEKTGQTGPMVQMSKEWVASRATREALDTSAERALVNYAADRRVLLVTFESSGSPEHGQAMLDILRGKPEAEVHLHPEHGITREWGAAEVDAVVAARNKAFEIKRAKAAAKPSASKPSKSPPK